MYMLPGDLNIRSGTVRYNNKILISDGTFSLGENDKVNTLELAKEGDMQAKTKSLGRSTTITHNLLQKPTHEEEKVALVLSLAVAFEIWHAFQ